MNFNKILITSLISISFLFTGFKEKASPISVAPNYEDFTYEQVLKEERVDSSNRVYTYFEYNFTNTGEGYINHISIDVVPYKTTSLHQKEIEGDIKGLYYVPYLVPECSATYYFEIDNYNDEELSFICYAKTEFASNVTHSSLNLEYLGTKGSADDPYQHVYMMTIDVSYDEENDYHYITTVFIDYKGNTYQFSDVYRGMTISAKEEIEMEQLEVRDVVVFKEKSISMDCIRHSPINLKALIIIFVTITLGLPLVGALVPVVILIVNKCKKPKEK